MPLRLRALLLPSEDALLSDATNSKHDPLGGAEQEAGIGRERLGQRLLSLGKNE